MHILSGNVTAMSSDIESFQTGFIFLDQHRSQGPLMLSLRRNLEKRLTHAPSFVRHLSGNLRIKEVVDTSCLADF